MSKPLAALASAIIVLCAQVAVAGVIINEKEVSIGGPQQRTGQRTVMVQGNKEKLVTPEHVFIIDLDHSVMYMLDLPKKTYSEMPFPPGGMAAQLIGGPAMHTANFARNGKSRTVAGYKCEEYAGSGRYMMAEYTIVQCVSAKAPGAKEFSAFQNAMMAKLKTVSVQLPATLPGGVPLAEDTTAKIVLKGPEMAKLPPDVAERLKKQFANRPPVVTKTEVTKITTKKLSADTFRPPANFVKSEPMVGHPSMGHPGMGHPGMEHPGMGQPPAAPAK
jgi:hypothetical protein